MSFIQEVKNEINQRTSKNNLFRAAGLGFFRGGAFIGSATESELKEFISGVFLSSAYGSIKKGTAGYHVEFVFEDFTNAQLLCEILAEREIFPKLTTRNQLPIIYIKSSDCVCNLLALVGATNSLLALHREIALRDIKNRANRLANCDTHNIDRQVQAAKAQVKAIKKLNLNTLDAKLKEVALARLASPEATYEELAAKLNLSKSGVVHRLKKLMPAD